MPLRLIDTDVEVPVEVSGTKIIVKPLTQGNKLRLAFIGQKFQEALDMKYLCASDEKEFDELLSNQIIKVENADYESWSPKKIIAGMDFTDKVQLMSELFRISSLNEDERKN